MSRLHNKIKQDKALWDLFTRREEYTATQADKHGRYTFAFSSYANILKPIVWKYLVGNGLCPQYPEGKKFAVCLTHDVDDIYPPLSHTLVSAFYCAKHLDFKELRKQVIGRVTGKASTYRNFHKIMALEDKYSARSTFFFIAAQKDPNRFRYNIQDLKSELYFIDLSGWNIGLHTGYYSYNDFADILKEKQMIEDALGKPIIGCRNHYLRFKTPDTWELLARVGFKYDSTYGYPDMIGFRNGMCGPFTPFNLNTGSAINILEIPLNIMDGTLFEVMRLDIGDAQKITRAMIDDVEELRGVLTVLFHNNIFSSPFRKKWAEFYEWLLQYCNERKAWLTSADEIYTWCTENVDSTYII